MTTRDEVAKGVLGFDGATAGRPLCLPLHGVDCNPRITMDRCFGIWTP
jgi:hypothetical protein